MKAMKRRLAAAKAAVDVAKDWEWGKECAEGTDGWETWKDHAAEAMAAVGSLLEDALDEGVETVNGLRAEFGLGPMEELPWDDVAEMVGWDVVMEKEG